MRITGKDTRIYLLLAVWSAVALLLLSPDSPLHGPWNRCDSAMFFMSGKALMNGLRPYVEFTDSKGPLLWLIYGVGYLLSPRSYTGVYVVSIFAYAGIFYYNYKTALLLLKDEGRAWAVTLLMTVVYFWPWFHFEVRAEDFATLPVAVSIYYLFRVLYGCGGAAAQPTVRRLGRVLGACFMALVLIKYNIAAMQGIIILALLWHLWRERPKAVLPALGWMSAGAAAVAAPFLLYFWMRGVVPSFIQEYFLHTFQTIGIDYNGNPMSADHDWKTFTGNWKNPVTLLILVLSGSLLGRRLPRYRWVPLLTATFFFALATWHNLPHYYSICHIFMLFLLVWLFGLSRKPLRRQWLWAVAAGVLLWGTAQNLQKDTNLWKICWWNDSKGREGYARISAAMDGSSKPRVLCLYSLDYGYGLWNDAFPAGNYWFYQLGTLPQMEREHIKLLESGNTDYVIINNEPRTFSKLIPPGMILSYGYTRVLRIDCHDPWGHEIRTAVYKKTGR